MKPSRNVKLVKKIAMSSYFIFSEKKIKSTQFEVN